MKNGTPKAPDKIYQAKHALGRAQSAYNRLWPVYHRLWRENLDRPEGSAPSEEFLRVQHLYQAVSAALSEAREELRLLQTARPIRKHKPYKYGPVSHDDVETE